MYRKILVPLDRSNEAEGVLPIVQDLLALGGEVVLLHVITPFREPSEGQNLSSGTPQEDQERARAMWYLRGLVRRIGGEFDPWYCEVAVSSSVADGIAMYAVRENADLIIMCTHDRKGLAKLIRGSIAEKVWYRAPIEVQVVRPRELIAR